MVHPKQLTPAFELLPKSLELIRNNLGMFILLSSASIVTATIGAIQRLTDHSEKTTGWESVASSALGADLNTGSVAGLGVLVAVFGVVEVIFMLMMYILSLRTAQGKKPNFDAVWSEFRQKGFKLFLLFICMALAVVAGFVLLIIPGVILLWRLSMTPYIMLDKGTDISESFVQSWEMTKGHAWPIYSIFLVSVVFALANLVPIVGALIALGLAVAYTCALPLRYEEIKHTHIPKAKDL